MKALYKYPQNAYPYENIVLENRHRDLDTPEYEVDDSGKDLIDFILAYVIMHHREHFMH